MKSTFLSFLFLLLSFSLFSQTLSIQGVLRDPNGRAVDDGIYSVTFKIYETESGGTAIWSEDHTSLAVKHGVFNAPLGFSVPFADVAFDEHTYVGVTVDGYSEMSPRIQLTTFPAAMAVNGTKNTFPSAGDVIIKDDHLVLETGALKLISGEIIFPDDTRLNSAEAGSANTITSKIDARIIADDDTTGSGEVTFAIADREEMVLNHDGELGVGTNNPENRLHVKSDAHAIATFENTHVNGTLIRLRSSSQSKQWDLRTDNNGFHLSNATDNVSVFTVGALNKVGIGNLTPHHLLSIGDYLGIDAGDGSTSAGTIRVGDVAGSLSGLSLNFTSTTGSPLMALKDNGNLEVQGELAANGGLKLSNMSSISSNIQVNSPLTMMENLTLAKRLNMGAYYLELGTGTLAGAEFQQNSSFTHHLDFRDNTGRLLMALTDEPKLAFPMFSLQSMRGMGDRPSVGSLNFGDGTGLKFHFHVPTTGNNVMTISDRGRIGIGTDEPIAALHVRRTVPDTIGISPDADLYNESHVRSWNHANFAVLAYFEGHVVSNLAFISATSPTFSDVRSKKIIGKTENEQDLQKLNQIQITDYSLIDKAIVGDTPQKKVIAQQIAEVYPQAVGIVSSPIPSVYQAADSFTWKNKELIIRTTKAHGFQVGDKVDLKTENESMTKRTIIRTHDPHTFVIASEYAPKELFVYGKWVDDFHTVDYDALSMLNISATQALAKKVEVLEAENANLRSQLDRIQLLEAKVTQLLNASTDRASLNR